MTKILTLGDLAYPRTQNSAAPSASTEPTVEAIALFLVTLGLRRLLERPEARPSAADNPISCLPWPGQHGHGRREAAVKTSVVEMVNAAHISFGPCQAGRADGTYDPCRLGGTKSTSVVIRGTRLATFYCRADERATDETTKSDPFAVGDKAPHTHAALSAKWKTSQNSNHGVLGVSGEPPVLNIFCFLFGRLEQGSGAGVAEVAGSLTPR